MKPVKPARRNWRLLLALPVVLILVLGSGAVVYAYRKPLPPITYTLAALPQPSSKDIQLNWPNYGQSAFGAVDYGVLATHGGQKAFPLASIAKVMTALVVLKEKPLQPGEQGPTITLTDQDVQIYNNYIAVNGSVAAVAAGAQISEYQALQALLLPSANNYADTLAIWSKGSVTAFNQAANDYAKELGMTTFTMTDPSGLLPETAASAHDATLLGIAALKNPVIAEIVGQQSATIPVAGRITNYNGVLGREGNIGIKTGNNDQNLGAFLFANRRTVEGKEITYVGAVMDAPNLYSALADSLPLAISGDSGFGTIEALQKSKIVATYMVPWQGSITASTTADARFFTWKTADITLKPAVSTPSESATSKQRVGSVKVTNGLDETTIDIPVTLDRAITKPSLWWRIRNIF
jgi:D-alanyl-D-alanine carboxypeptidase (penicillin-binding protein 5/6)